MNCSARHTEHQFKADDVLCPKCGGRDNSIIEEVEFVTPEESDCVKIHSDAKFMCLNCEMEWTGEQLAKLHAAQEKCAEIMKEAQS